MSNRLAGAVVVFVVIADRCTKALIIATMTEGTSIPVVPGLLSLTYVRNPGAAFGLLADVGAGWRDGFLIMVGLVAVTALGWMLVKLPQAYRWQRAAAAAVIGGAFGNLYDRLAYGQVVDFVDAYVGRWHWPAFNVADSCITVGVLVLVAASIVGERSKESRLRSSNDTTVR